MCYLYETNPFLSRNIHLNQRFYFVQFLVIQKHVIYSPPWPHDPNDVAIDCVCVARFEHAFVIQILLIFNTFIVLHMIKF
jgi:hypothetical protein